MYTKTTRCVEKLRLQFPALTPEDAPLDPARFVLRCGDGFDLSRRLEALGVYPEMADTGHVVFLMTCADGEAEFDRLTRALTALQPLEPSVWETPAPPPPPEQVCSPRQALFSTGTVRSVEEAEGLVSTDQVAPYPPGIPVIAPGERVEKKHLSYLRQIGYNMKNKIGVL